jgi:LL-diaminopimelate aminotransferase
MIEPSIALSSLPTYAFVDVKNKVKELIAKGIKPIDFGIGDPKEPTPSVVREALKKAVDTRKSAGYPLEEGEIEYRKTISDWSKKRFGFSLNPDTEICANIGAKEAVFNFHHAFVSKGDYVLIPNPGYPPYEKGTIFSGGIPYFMPLLKENHFLPDLSKIPANIAKKAKIIWVNYPNNPTTALAPDSFYKELLDFAEDYDIIVASDECYSEMYYEKKPRSLLEFKKEGVVQIQSLSKRSNMTCYRVGWLAGDENIIKWFKKLKPNIDSGTATFIQDAAIAALNDENHVEEMRKSYALKRDMMIDAFTSLGLENCKPSSTLYIWQRVAKGYTSVEFAKKLLDHEVAVVTTPGPYLSKEVDGVNPGEGFIRLALVPTIEDTKLAVQRLAKLEL